MWFKSVSFFVYLFVYETYADRKEMFCLKSLVILILEIHDIEQIGVLCLIIFKEI